MAKAWSNKGSALVGLGRYEEALIAFTKAIEIDPKNGRFLGLTREVHLLGSAALRKH